MTSKIWLSDPVTGLSSISLSLLVASFALLVVASSLHMLGKVAHTGAFAEMFYSTAALYFGRRFNIGSKTYSSDKAEEVIEKAEKA